MDYPVTLRTLFCLIAILGQQQSADGQWADVDSSIPSCPAYRCPENREFCSYATTYGNESTSCGTVLTRRCQSGYYSDQSTQQCVGGQWTEDTERPMICYNMRGYIGCMSFPPNAIPLSNMYKWNSATSSFVNQDTFAEKTSQVTSAFPLRCMWLCFELSADRYILMGGDECICLSGDRILQEGSIEVNNTDCNTECVGDTSYFCGGGGYIGSVYNVRPIDGCYTRLPETSLPRSLVDTRMSETVCSQLCAVRDYEFSAVLSTNCVCLDKQDLYNNFVPINAPKCQRSCSSLNTELCGSLDGDFNIQDNGDLYLPNNCEALFNRGIRRHGTYKLTSGIARCNMPALESCREMEAHLATFDNSPSFSFLRETVIGYTPWNITDGWWLGYYDDTLYNQIVSRSGLITSHRHLGGATALNSYHCSAMNMEFKSQVEFSCGNKMQGFICEKHATIPECVQLDSLPDPTLMSTHAHPTKMSGTLCIQLCMNKRWTLSPVSGMYHTQKALLHNDTCHCVDKDAIELTLIEHASSIPCDLSCPGHHKQACGADTTSINGTITYSVYHVWTPESLARSCNDLLFNRIDVDGNYSVFDNGSATTVFCNFTFHKEHCPGGFFYIEEDNICAMPSVAAESWALVFDYCSQFEAFPIIKPPYDSSNSIIALLESIRVFDGQSMYHIGKLDPLLSNNFLWVDGSLLNATLDDTILNNGTFVMNRPNVVWYRKKHFVDYVLNSWILSFVCVKELSYHAPFPLMPKAFCMSDKDIELSDGNILFFYDDYMTMTLCVELCKGQKSYLRYALIQGQTCHCASAGVFLTHKRTGNLKCGTPCPGNGYQYCGNVSSVMVMDKERYIETASSCMDLFQQGVRVHSTYMIASPNGGGSVVTECYGTEDHPNPITSGNEDWLSWGNDHFSYLFVTNDSRDDSMTALEQCWSYGLGAYPVSITSQEEKDFLISVLAGDAFLREHLDWEIGYVYSRQLDEKSWNHPDLYLLHSKGGYYSFLDDEAFCSSTGDGQCCMHILPREQDDVEFVESYEMCSSNKTNNLICKTTKNFLGCKSLTGLLATLSLSDEEDMSVLLCTEHCRGLGKLFAAVSAADCYCTDHNPGYFTPYDTSKCQVACPGRPFQYCGSNDKALWYSLDRVFPSEVAYDCIDIIDNGILFNSTYRTVKGKNYEICSYSCGTLRTSAILDTTVTVYKTNVTYHCPQGQEIGLHKGWIECRRDGWTRSTDLCSDIHCPSLDVDHSILNTTRTKFNETVAVRCATDYHIKYGVDRFQVTCQENQEWLPEIKECIRIRCNWTSSDLNLTSSPQVGLEFDSGVILNLLCKDGYRFPHGTDIMEVRCTKDLTWDPQPEGCLPYCDPVQPSTVMATVSRAKTWWGIRLFCYQGYQMYDGNTVMESVCVGNDWSPPVMNCSRQCSKLTGLLNAYSTVIDTNKVNVTCLPNSQLTNGQSSSHHKCQNGVWVPSIQDCTPVPVCPYFETANLNATVTNVSDNVIALNCFKDLYFSAYVNKRVHVCTQDQWEPDLEMCRKLCDVPQVKNANVTLLDLDLELLEVECHTGHSTPSGSTNQNTACVDGMWTPAIEDCVKAPCPNLQSEMADITFDTIDDVQIAHVTCRALYQFYDESTTKMFVCGEDREWIPSSETCITACGMISDNNAIVKWYAVNSTAMSTVTCNRGYILEVKDSGENGVSQKYTCLDGDWTPKVQECFREPCEKLRVANSQIVYSDFYGAEMVTAKCETSFYFLDGSDEKIFLCDHGAWSPEAENCIAQCDEGDLNALENVVIKEVSTTGHPFYDIQCVEGYKFDDGSTKMTSGCGSDGQWHDALRNCSGMGCSLCSCFCVPFEVIRCRRLQGYSHVQLSSKLDVYMETVTLTCDPGYVFLVQNYTNVKVIQCQADGQWVPSPENCIFPFYRYNVGPAL